MALASVKLSRVSEDRRPRSLGRRNASPDSLGDNLGNIEHEDANAGLIECNLEARDVPRQRRYVERNRCLALEVIITLEARIVGYIPLMLRTKATNDSKAVEPEPIQNPVRWHWRKTFLVRTIRLYNRTL